MIQLLAASSNSVVSPRHLQGTRASWLKVANATGCRNRSSPQTELVCLKRQPPRNLKRGVSLDNFIDYRDLSGGLPVTDNEMVFEPQEYVTWGLSGDFARVVWLSCFYGSRF